MIIKFSALNLIVIFIWVFLFPLVQKQWLNLYLFDINNFSFYKVLYYLSGLISSTLIFINSLNKFTFYQFNINKERFNNAMGGKTLFFIALSSSLALSWLVSIYLFSFIEFFLKVVINDSFVFNINFSARIFLIFIFIILSLFRKTNILLKKINLLIFFSFTSIIWYSKINNISIEGKTFFNNYLNIDNIYFLNILFISCIEIMYYLWSFISNNNNLSEWKVPVPYVREVIPIFSIISFYCLVAIYYLILES